MNYLGERKQKKQVRPIKYNKRYNILLAFVTAVILIYILYSIINLIKSPTDVFAIEYGKVSLEEPAIRISN